MICNRQVDCSNLSHIQLIGNNFFKGYVIIKFIVAMGQPLIFFKNKTHNNNE